jgi:CO/xanthine dehydrogenase FAD-binding subunit
VPKQSYVTAYNPQSINGVFSILKKRQPLLIFAGGTYLLAPGRKSSYRKASAVMNIKNVKELQRITRTDRNIEIGAAAGLNRILSIGALLPAAMYEALRSIGSIPLRNCATIGGNLCCKEQCLSLYVLSTLMDMRLELRRQGGSRWIPGNRFRNSAGEPILAEDEILSRIRIPLERWNMQFFRSFGSAYIPQTNPLHVCGLAKIDGDSLSDLRMAAATGQPKVIRDRELEAELMGRRLPLGDRERESAYEKIAGLVASADYELTDFQRERVSRLFRCFLNDLVPE